MLIMGLQKLTLLDYPGRVACTVFTGGCNLLCPFCHNASLVKIKEESQISTESFFDFLKKRSKVLDGVCISGGEPLIQNDIEAFLAEIKKLNFAVKLDTNGVLSDKLISIIEKNLVDYVAMDIKNSPERYAETVGVEGFSVSEVKKSVDYLIKGKLPYEFRTTLSRELFNEESIEKIGEWISGCKAYYLQNFKDSGDILSGNAFTPIDKQTLKKYQKLLEKHNINAFNRGE